MHLLTQILWKFVVYLLTQILGKIFINNTIFTTFQFNSQQYMPPLNLILNNTIFTKICVTNIFIQ